MASEDTKAKIVKQVEFYFSDVNIAKDTFLKTKMAESAEGFVSIGTLLTFKRLAALVEGLPDKEKVVADALEDSASLVVDKDALAVRRRHALPESIATDDSTLYAKPIPPTATLEELQDYFGQFGTVRAVWRRPLPGAKASAGAAAYKDSVFVVFDSPQTMLKVCAAPPKAMNSEEPLTVMSKQAYLESKAGAKKATEKVQAAQKDFSLRTPPMPTNASIRISGCGQLEGFKAVKSLWAADLQSGIRYVSLNDSKDVATVIFQDAATCDRMLADVKEKGTTLNGVAPTIVRLENDEDKAATEAAEKEISERAASRAEQGGRGGRGRGRGRGRGGARGRGGKRERD